MILGMYFLPKQDQTYLLLFKTWALPILELSIVSIIIFKLRKAIQSYKAIKVQIPDFFETLVEVCKEVMPKRLVLPFATEVAVIYYGFFAWKEREFEDNEFTLHRKGGSTALFGGIIMMIVVETFALHLLIGRWNETIAWIFTILSVYTILQFFGFSKALSRRPIVLSDDQLTLRYSIMNECIIDLIDIDFIELSRKKPLDDKMYRTLSPLGDLESQNVILHLKRPYILKGLYGIKKEFTSIGLNLDEPKIFKAMLEPKSMLNHD
ncbi:MAG: hypothetical protein HRT74_08380 [Flavobacteriales bacterium]|nr:hypothetical protein [Flavobacteriales bacterium]